MPGQSATSLRVNQRWYSPSSPFRWHSLGSTSWEDPNKLGIAEYHTIYPPIYSLRRHLCQKILSFSLAVRQICNFLYRLMLIHVKFGYQLMRSPSCLGCWAAVVALMFVVCWGILQVPASWHSWCHFRPMKTQRAGFGNFRNANMSRAWPRVHPIEVGVYRAHSRASWKTWKRSYS